MKIKNTAVKILEGKKGKKNLVSKSSYIFQHRTVTVFRVAEPNARSILKQLICNTP